MKKATKRLKNQELFDRALTSVRKKPNLGRIELAEDSITQEYQKEINMVLHLLEHPEALTTDLSRISDFAPTAKTMQRIKRILNPWIKITKTTYIIDLGKAMRNMKDDIISGKAKKKGL